MNDPTKNPMDTAHPEPDWDQLLDPFMDRVKEALGDEYKDISLIKRGGMSFVLKAKTVVNERPVAIKVLPAELVTDYQLINRFKREAQIAQTLNHPHILPVVQVGSRSSLLFFTMAYMPGGNLAQRLGKPFSEDAIRHLGITMALALDHAHQKSVIHRDVKPANIMFDDQDKPMLGDFGIARAAYQTKLTGTQSFLGTPHYLSPEQALGKEVDKTADIYSLGAVMYHMAAAAPLFDQQDPLAISYSHVHHKPPRINRTDLSPELIEVIMTCLEKNPKKRYGSGAALARALGADQPGFETLMLQASIAPSGKLVKKKKWPWFAAVAAVAAIIMLLAFLMWPKQVPLPEPAMSNFGQPVPLNPIVLSDPLEIEQLKVRTISSPRPKPKPKQPEPEEPKPIVLPNFDFISLPAGTFRMGSRDRNEKPVHTVSLSAFEMMSHEVTQAQWQAVMEEQRGCLNNPNLPVTLVSYEQIQLFIKKYKEITGQEVRLPTEAEWEYACQAGDRNFLGNADSDQTWYEKNAEQVQPVATKEANDWGLFDMNGNVWEWCQDFYSEDYYSQSPAQNPMGPETGAEHAIRGGSYQSSKKECRSSHRESRHPQTQACDLGFRLVRVVK